MLCGNIRFGWHNLAKNFWNNRLLDAMTDISPELVQALSSLLTNAIRASTANIATASGAETVSSSGLFLAALFKTPTFTVPEYHSTDGTTVRDYFQRFDWALQLSKIPVDLYATYARVYMGTELNNALKFLISPRSPESLTYDEIQTALVKHFDRAKNKFAESIKFRHIVQSEDETVANFILRLRQGAVYCDYGAFLDRMLIEQFLCGLKSKEMCDEIIAKNPVTFSEAYEIANSLEATRITADTIKTTSAGSNNNIQKLSVVSVKVKHSKKTISYSVAILRSRESTSHISECTKRTKPGSVFLQWM